MNEPDPDATERTDPPRPALSLKRPDDPDATVSSLTEAIVASYRDLELIHHLAHCPLPSNDAVVGIVLDVTELLFPGYRGRQDLNWDNIDYFVGSVIDSLRGRMTEQFSRAFRHDALRRAGRDCEQEPPEACPDLCRRTGAETGDRLLAALPALRELLVDDVRAAYEGDPAAAGYDEIVFCYPGFAAITLHRIAHALVGLGVPVVPRMIAEFAHARTGIDIHPGATIGRSFFIDHGTGVVIGETCDIAERVKIYQGVTLGAKSFAVGPDGDLVRGQKRHPTVEADVVIYSNATVLGGETTIGRGSVVGAGVTLTKSCGPNTIVTVEKAQLRFREAV
ncbi:MAG: serine acetyltransferase [Planctomycetota bacterium]